MSMSFNHQLKIEIIGNKPLRVRNKLAQAHGLLLCGRAFGPDEITLYTESEQTAEVFGWLVNDLLDERSAAEIRQRTLSAKLVYACRVPQANRRARLVEIMGGGEGVSTGVINSPERVQAFLAGAYLACGNITDPNKSYHLEFVVRNQRLADDLHELLDAYIPGAKVSRRRSAYVIYYKECGQIEDLLTLIGAPRASLAMIDVEMLKGVRNQANRVTNCETANIDKQVVAATSQVEDIHLVFSRIGEEALPQNLREAARLRLDNPDMSLRELCEAAPFSISRSGMHHRLEKLTTMARELRAGREEA